MQTYRFHFGFGVHVACAVWCCLQSCVPVQVRVGAVACHEDKSAAEQPLDEQFKTSMSHLYDLVEEDETVEEVAARLGVGAFDIVFLNKGIFGK